MLHYNSLLLGTLNRNCAYTETAFFKISIIFAKTFFQLDGDTNEHISVLHGCGALINALCHLEFP